jgi:hypothetical protein
MDGVSSGTLTQTLDTISGHTYTVTFGLSGNPDGQGITPGDKGDKVLDVQASGSTVNTYHYDTSVELNSLNNMKWAPHIYTFVASSSSTTLTFSSQTVGFYGPALDNVAITDNTIGTSFMVKPWTYDPGKTRKVSSAWVTHEGLKDAGGSDHTLYMTKKTATEANAAGGATVTYSGTLSSLGFDYRNDGWCGAGAPRFNVYTTTGTYYFFGCTYGTHTSSTESAAWTRVSFNNTDAFPADGTTAWPGFGNVTVTGIDIVYDEGTTQNNQPLGQGFAYLDNIQVNGVYAGKPGLAQ